MRLLLSLSLLGLGTTIVLAGTAGRADAGAARATATATQVRAARADVDRYRLLAWTFQRVAEEPRTPTSYSYRRSSDPSYLEWTLEQWQRTAYEARGHALARLRRQTHRKLPHAPKLHAVLGARIAFDRTLTVDLRRIYPGRVSKRFASARGPSAQRTLALWERRSAAAALLVAAHPLRARRAAHPRRGLLDASDPLDGEFLCIHRFEGSWTANTGNGYYGGLQMDWPFMRTYGSDYLARWGTADGWPAWAQLEVAERAYRSGRGFWPWPNSARACGLL
ncbi:MAG TPA: hypothetical protein VHC45_17095 [Gaiellaceae bacterium]|nr:hypothetical protein [Gaiellaceae bacterium]